MDAKQNAELMREVFGAIERRDAQRVFGLCHADVEFHWPRPCRMAASRRASAAIGRGGPRHGCRSSPPRRSNRWNHASWRPLTERSSCSGDSEVSAPNGERLDTPVLGLYQVRDGKLARAQMFYFDPVAVADFLVRAS